MPFADITIPEAQHWMKRIKKHELGLFHHSLHVAKLVTDYTRFEEMSMERAWPMIEGPYFMMLVKLSFRQLFL